MKLRFSPLTPDTWDDLVALFGEKGACGGCWCMWWRLTHTEFERQKGPANRQALEKLVRSGEVPGILAYDGPRPVGWCSVAPRDRLPRLARSRILKPVDSAAVWSIVCFFVDREYRHRTVSRGLVEAAKDWVARQGGKIVEGYPVEPEKERVAPLFVYTGLASTFARAGFQEVARRSPTRPIMRFAVEPGQDFASNQERP